MHGYSLQHAALRRLTALGLSVSLASAGGCAALKRGEVKISNFTEGRLTDVRIAEETVGAHEVPFLSIPVKKYFLEGAIQGFVVDDKDEPVAKLLMSAEANPAPPPTERGEKPRELVRKFESGDSDTAGVYRIPFRLELDAGRADVQGKIVYATNADEVCQRDHVCVHPLTAESAFHLVFDRGTGILTFREGLEPVRIQTATRSGQPGSTAP